MRTDGVLALIPARGGSKGLPRKNIRLLQGHPLVAYSIAAARQARHVTRVVCSTDDEEIAAVARRYAADVPFLRPPELAQDHTLDLPVFHHALRWFEEHEDWRPRLAVQLRPTSPIRLPGQIDEAIELLDQHVEATGVRTVCPAPCNPYKMWRLPEDMDSPDPYMRNLLEVPGNPEPYNSPRQVLPPVWWQTGTIDVVRSEVILAGSMSGRFLLPLRIPAWLAVDIDGETGLRLAELVMTGLDCVRPQAALPWGRIRLLALDVDGTLTPGTMYYGPAGEALKRFHTHDGHGIALVRALGVVVAVVTRERSAFAVARARKLGIEEVHVGIQDKITTLRTLCARHGVRLDEVAYVGDDLPDLEVMLAVGRAGGIACAVADARPEIARVATYVCPSRGGQGAVRDVCDRIREARPAGGTGQGEPPRRRTRRRPRQSRPTPP